jgi:hypothetical protein
MFFIFIKKLKLLLIINVFIVKQFYYKNCSFVKSKINNNISNKKYYLFNSNKFNYLKKNFNKINYIKALDIRYSFSFKYKIVKIEYNIGFYDEEENLISPFEISLYSNMSIVCNIEIEYNKINIDSLANIKNNKYFNCIEFFNINERITLGIKAYNIDDNHLFNYMSLFKNNFFDYNIIKFNIDVKFNSLIINNQFNLLLKNINNNNNKFNGSYKLKNSYINYPLYSLKRNSNMEENFWKFKNIFGDYFCYCKGKKCLELKIIQECKFKFYVNKYYR